MILASITTLGNAESPSWPCWRGPNHDGFSTETGWNPLALKDGARVLWKADVGSGYSDVVIQDGRLYTMGMVEAQTTVICLDAMKGTEIWRYAFKGGGNPEATPAVEGGRVYAVSIGGAVLCLQADDGTLVWRKHLMMDAKAKFPGFGWATSPLVVGNRVYINANSAGVAFDAVTGEVAWRSDVDPGGTASLYGSYASPVPFECNNVPSVIMLGPAALNVVEPSSGKVLWSYVHHEPDESVADPVVWRNQLFLAGPDSVLFEFREGETGEIWRNRELVTGITTAVCVGDFLYGTHYGLVELPFTEE
jgi:outer membrane protein assembly factor BamB